MVGLHHRIDDGQAIGPRRALGATRGQIRAQILSESLLLSLLGGATGAVLGATVTWIYAGGRSWTVVVPPLSLAAAVGAALAIGGLAGLNPAVRTPWPPPRPPRSL